MQSAKVNIKNLTTGLAPAKDNLPAIELAPINPEDERYPVRSAWHAHIENIPKVSPRPSLGQRAYFASLRLERWLLARSLPCEAVVRSVHMWFRRLLFVAFAISLCISEATAVLWTKSHRQSPKPMRDFNEVH